MGITGYNPNSQFRRTTSVQKTPNATLGSCGPVQPRRAGENRAQASSWRQDLLLSPAWNQRLALWDSAEPHKGMERLFCWRRHELMCSSQTLSRECENTRGDRENGVVRRKNPTKLGQTQSLRHECWMAKEAVLGELDSKWKKWKTQQNFNLWYVHL